MTAARWTVTTRFPGGSAEDLRRAGDGVVFAAGHNGSPYSMWWHFTIRGAQGLSVPCTWEHTGEVLGSSQVGMTVPVYTDEKGVWRRVNPRQCRYDPAAGQFTFLVPCHTPRVEVAFSYPYTLAQAEALVRAAVRQPGVTVSELARSEQGRACDIIEVGEGDWQVWVTARHHAGETPGAYVLEGLLQAVLASPELRRVGRFHFVPVMDVDGVAEGWYGKDRVPRDFNRDYCTGACRPEVAAVMQAAEAGGRVDVMLDLHAPCPGDRSFVVTPKETFLNLNEWQQAGDFARWLEALAPRSCPVRVADISRTAMNWSGANYHQTSTGYFNQRFAALALCVESTYHRTADGRLVTPAGWRGVGGALARTLAVAVGLQSAPPVDHLPRPEWQAPRLQGWRLINLPQETIFQMQGQTLEITGSDAGGSAWVVCDKLLATRRPALQWQLSGSAEMLRVTAKGFETRGVVPTGVITDRDLPASPTDQPRRATVAAPDSHNRLLVQVRGLRGRLVVTVG